MAKIDSEDEFKRQMRRRLVGAVALVTALVVILPMLLENSPKPQQDNLELRIPDKNKSGAFTSQMVVAESAPDVTPLPTPGAGQAQPAASAPTTEKTVKPAASAQPAHPAKPAPAAAHGKDKPAKAVASGKAAAGEAHASAAPKSAVHKSAAHKAGFAVQVGAFSHAATAKELEDKLIKRGWHVYTEKAGGTMRVRVGPYGARAEAEKAQHKLESQGVRPAAVVTEP
jgi:DedD protein